MRGEAGGERGSGGGEEGAGGWPSQQGQARAPGGPPLPATCRFVAEVEAGTCHFLTFTRMLQKGEHSGTDALFTASD